MKKTRWHGCIVFKDADGEIQQILPIHTFVALHRIMGRSEEEIKHMLDETIDAGFNSDPEVEKPPVQ